MKRGFKLLMGLDVELFRAAFRVGVVIAILASTACTNNGLTQTAPELSFALRSIDGLTTDQKRTGGVSFADINGDGHFDVFVGNGYDNAEQEPTPQDNKLYLGDGRGGFVETEAPDLLSHQGFSSGSTWADMDNDGDLDVFIPNQRDQENFLLRQEASENGELRFTPLDNQAPWSDKGWSYSASWADVDNDGLVDLHVSNGGLSHAGANALYKNLGDGKFEKITSGKIVEDVQASGANIWADFDLDGDVDLFIANHQATRDGSRENSLYRNDGDFQFTEVGSKAFGGLLEYSIAAAWGDVDNDGDSDLLVGNLYGQANSLFINQGNGAFVRRPNDPLSLDGGNTGAVGFADFDNDGDLDAIVGDDYARVGIYINQGAGRYARAFDSVFLGEQENVSAIAIGDADNDGDLDIYLGNWPVRSGEEEENRFLENRLTEGRSWLKVKLIGTESNASALGARVLVTAEINGQPVTQTREVNALASWRSQSEMTLHFGLGDAAQISDIRVIWPSGTTQEWGAAPIKETILIREGDAAFSLASN